MLSFLKLCLLFLATIARAQTVPGCSSTSAISGTALPTTISACTLFYTPSMPPQIGPTSTVYATMMTTQFNVVNCNYCQISNVDDNPMPTGPFTTKVTSNYLLITQIACIPHSSAVTRRHALPEATPEPTDLYIRGAKPITFTPGVRRGLPLPEPLNHFKRQIPTNNTGNPLMLAGEPSRLVEQLFTVIYSISVINSGADLEEICLQLQSANAILDLAQVGLNATQAAAIVCSASLPDSRLASFNQTLIASAAAGLYGVQLAANFTGTVNTTRLCAQLDLSPLPALGVDVNAVQSFICTANNAISTASDDSGVPTTVPSGGTMASSVPTNSSGGNQTWFGSITNAGPTSSVATVPLGTSIPAASTGPYPTGNLSAIGANAGSSAATVPLGTSIPAVGTGPYPTGNLSAIGANAESSAAFATGNRPAGTGTVTSGTAVYGAGDAPAATGNTGPGVQMNASGDPFAGTGTAGSGAGITVTGLPSAEYGTSPSTEGYGEEASERVPHGPTSTPRYYPKYY